VKVTIGVTGRKELQEMMLYLKACPRCQGDVKYESDVYGKFLECLQCGFLISSHKVEPRGSGEEDDRAQVTAGSEAAA
tara:strand:- start:292 stop:525 length:234 start_codon:yes stop_codon:yes gene_type:complete